VLRPGLAVSELAVSPLPGNPTAVFTVRRAHGDEFDAYIVVSFTNATLVSLWGTIGGCLLVS
jgi:splicing factor 3B subunit 3